MRLTEARQIAEALPTFEELKDAYVEYRMATKGDDYVRSRNSAYANAATALGSFAPDIRKQLERAAQAGQKDLAAARRTLLAVEKRVVKLENQVPDALSKKAHNASRDIASRMWRQQMGARR